MKIEIKSGSNGAVLFSHKCENNTIRITVEAAVRAGANLDGANLDGETLTTIPLSLLNLRWPVLVTDNFMRIGCKRHTHADWAAFTTAEIEAMNSCAASFWAEWGDILLAICKQHKGQ